MSMQPTQRYRKLPHAVIVRAPGLLPMLYKVRELAQELGIPERTLRDWLAGGAPHERDPRGHIWVNGELFAAWVNAQRKQKKDKRLGPDEGYCVRCRKAVQLTGVDIIPLRAKLVQVRGRCPHCNTEVYRGGRRGQPAELSMG
jgi:hypothetical protein